MTEQESSFIPLEKRKYEPLGPKSAEIIKRSDTYSATNYASYPFVVSKAKGPWLYDPDGNKALDFLAAYSAVLSHRHPRIVSAVKNVMENGTDLTGRALYPELFANFVEKVCKFTGYARVQPKSDGGSVTDSAMKGLFKHAAKRGMKDPKILLTNEFFHGRAWVFASNAIFDAEQSEGCLPRAPGIEVIDHTPEAMKEAIEKHNVIGIFVETHKGEGGPLFYNEDTYMAMRELARQKNIFFGCDEIQTGLGRCGYNMAWQEFGEKARPDFVTIGKALGGGLIPVSAVVGNEEYMKIFTPGSDGCTWGGYSLACAAAVESLNVIEQEEICEKAKQIGNYFVKKMQGVEGINVENRGSLIRVEIEGVKSAKPACYEMLLGKNRNPRVFMKHGHYDASKNVAYTRIAPPIGAMTNELIDEAVEKTIIPVLQESRRKE